MTSHNADIQNGTYTANIGTTTLHAFCNDNEGLAIYAAGYTGNEVGGTNSNKLVGTSASGNAAIITGLATTTGSPDVSNWAMKLAISQDSGDTTGTNALVIDSAPNISGGANASFSQYHTVPNEYVKVAHKNAATDMTQTTGGVKLTTTYAAYISKTQPADTYSGQVIYTLVHPASHAAPVAYNTNANNISDVNFMQEFGKVSNENLASIYASMTPGQQYTVTDARDGKEYTIAKLPTSPETEQEQLGTMQTASITENGIKYNIWMTSNLDLDLDASRTYTNEDTDLGYNTTTGQYQTAAWRPSSSTMTSANANWTMSLTTPESYDPGNLYWNGTQSDGDDWNAYLGSCYDPESGDLQPCDESLNPLSSYTSSTGSVQYRLGNYYNWTAAIAMNDSSSKIDSAEVIEQSICPVGWTLPRIGRGEDSFYALWSQYGYTDQNGFSDISTLWSSPLYFTASGMVYDGVLGGVGDEGDFWSPTAGYDDYVVRNARFRVNGFVDPLGWGGRDGGSSVRCVARPVTSSIVGGGGIR